MLSAHVQNYLKTRNHHGQADQSTYVFGFGDENTDFHHNINAVSPVKQKLINPRSQNQKPFQQTPRTNQGHYQNSNNNQRTHLTTEISHNDQTG